MSRRTWLLVVLGVAGGAMLVRFGLVFPWNATVSALADADPWLLAGAAAANLLSLAAKAGVWYLLLRKLGPARAGTAQAATLVAAAVNSVTVAGSGEAVRAQLVHDKDGIPYSAALTSLVATRLVEALGLLLVLLVAVVLLRPGPAIAKLAEAMIVILLALILGARLLPARLWPRSAAGLIRGSGGIWIAPAILAALNWGAQWIAYHWSIEATHLAITPVVSLTALLAANLAGLLRLTPGNVGVIQASLVLGLGAFTIPPAQALAAGLALQAAQVLPVLAAGLTIMGARGFRQAASQHARTA